MPKIPTTIEIMDELIKKRKGKMANIPQYRNNNPAPKQNNAVSRQNIPVPIQNIPVPMQNIPVSRQNTSTPNPNPTSWQEIPQNVIPQNPGALIEGIKVIAKIIHFRQQFKPEESVFAAKIQNQSQTLALMPGPSGQQSTEQQILQTSSDSQIVASTSSSSVEVLSVFDKLKSKSNEKPRKRFRKRPNKQRRAVQSDNSFSITEITEEVAELNDDNLINQTIDISKQDNKKNTFKQSQQSFQMKLQEQHAKKLKTRNNSETIQIPGHSDHQSAENKPQSHTSIKSDGTKKQANQEVIQGLMSDIKTVVRENVTLNTNEPRNFVFNELPKMAGVPRSFLLKNQNSYAAIQPQASVNPPVSRWDLQTPLSQHIPATTTQTFAPTPYANTAEHRSYSPTEVYQELKHNEGEHERSESPDVLESGQKRTSAFQRLGPLAQPKKSKLTINLSLSKDQAVREVVEIQKDIPVYDNEEIINSTDEIVIKYLPFWPWKKNVPVKKCVTARTSKTVMMMEQEQMLEIYEKDCNSFMMLWVRGYPPNWTKEDLLDMMIENLKGKNFIPCFIEFTSKDCKFFVMRSRGALMAIHTSGFTMKKDDVEITITIGQTLVTLKKIDFLPRAILKKRLRTCYDGERMLDLSEFTLKYDISHFIYYPLYREYNQSELIRMQSDVIWEYLTELNLSRNRITSLEGFCLETTTPKLRNLDISYNCLDSIKALLKCRKLPLKRLILEGNPLCTDYTDPDRYIRIVRTIFPCIIELDGIPITLKGEMPRTHKNYCPEGAEVIVEKFLEIFFPLLELPQESRRTIQTMYSEDAVLTITYRSKMRHDHKFKNARNLLIKSRVLLEGDSDEIHGASHIAKLLKKWPDIQHDPTTFTVDVMHHTEQSTILRVSGILKLTAESLAEDETILSFTRTVHLYSKNGHEYKIYNEMLYWDEPTEACSKRAFQMLSIPKKMAFDLKFESTPDDDTKEQLVKIFMKLTDLEKLPSEKCLEAKDWHIEHALEYYMKLLKLDVVHCLN